MKSILILIGLLSAIPHTTVLGQIRRPILLPPINPPIGPTAFTSTDPSIYSTNYPTAPSFYSTNYPTAVSVYSTNYPTATGSPYTTSNFSLSRTLSYATSSPVTTKRRTTTSTRFTTVTIVPLPIPIIPLPHPIIPLPGYFPCEPDTLFCNTLTTFSLCAPGLGGKPPRPMYMGRVAPGTLCRYGRIVRAEGGDCSPIGRLACSDSGRNFYLCSEGGELDMGPVAKGTDCIAGNIIAIE